MRKVVKLEELYSDLSGDKAEKLIRVPFTWDGKRHNLELTPGEAATFEGLMTPYVEAATKARNDAGKSDDERNDDSAEIRVWAQAKGMDVGEKGRIPNKVRAAFYAEQSENDDETSAKSGK